MAEPFFRLAEIVVPGVAALNGTKLNFEGLENIPARGGGLIALNHTSYLDWVGASVAAKERKRRLRFMIKAAVAVQRLREGELVGVHPEATISRSYELREFKTGAARMALQAQVPIIPMVVWGAHRIWPKDHPKKLLRNKIPVTVAAGPPLPPQGTAEQLNVALREAINAILYRVQEEYPHPEGEFWVPRRLGGSAPSQDVSRELRIAELAERVEKQGGDRVARPGQPRTGSPQ